MVRVHDVVVDELDVEQRQAYAEIAGSRGGSARGPFSVWLSTPAVAVAASRFGDALRMHGRLARPLSEIITLVAAARWKAAYPWVAHERAALESGLDPAAIEAIRTRRTPAFGREDERIVHDVGVEILGTGTLASASYERALDALGLPVLTEVVTSYGWYTAAAFVANAFEVAVPGGRQPFGPVDEQAQP
jgi:4-carboxymuconolactone decarboxylase